MVARPVSCSRILRDRPRQFGRHSGAHQRGFQDQRDDGDRAGLQGNCLSGLRSKSRTVRTEVLVRIDRRTISDPIVLIPTNFSSLAHTLPVAKLWTDGVTQRTGQRFWLTRDSSTAKGNDESFMRSSVTNLSPTVRRSYRAAVKVTIVFVVLGTPACAEPRRQTEGEFITLRSPGTIRRHRPQFVMVL